MITTFTIEDKRYRIESHYIETVALFGSYARGDTDKSSDIDILVVVDDCDETEFVGIKKDIAKQLDIPVSWISVYRKRSIQEMCTFGSYFLWHLKLEGIILFSRTGFMEGTLEELPRYRKAKQDLLDYKNICNDIIISLNKDTITLDYELAVLASLARNTCIALAYLKGFYVFGRISPIKVCIDILGEDFPFTLDEYKELYEYRIRHTRGQNFVGNLQNISAELVYLWVTRIEKLINISLEIVERSD